MKFFKAGGGAECHSRTVSSDFGSDRFQDPYRVPHSGSTVPGGRKMPFCADEG